ncbi:hypothetical protein DRP04_09750 [Archaeoglobales archaeon]|nr:MAG: hypothetical protein DRP04_09750 [Archaeoglobales archaeon]
MLEELRDEIARLKRVIESSNHPFTASRRLVSNAIELVARDEFERAKELLRNAYELAMAENAIFSNLSRLKDMIKVDGRAASIARSIEDKIRNGELKEAENLIKELEETVKAENRIIEKIKEAEELASRKLAGANLEEAERLRSEAERELLKGNFGSAEELAEKAKLAAKPTTEYLLGKAREVAARAETEFAKENYEKAIELWKKSIEEYSRALEVAEERKETEIVERINEVNEILRENIEKAEIAIDNRDMLKFVSEANKYVEEANSVYSDAQRLYEEKSYGEAAEKYKQAESLYEEAKDGFEKALKLAEKREFEGEKKKIEEALSSVEESILACQLARGESLVSEAESLLFHKKLEEAENKFSATLSYLESIGDKAKELKLRCAEGLIEAKIKQAEEEMKECEELMKGGKYYDAKEAYREIRNKLERVVDEATSLEATSKLGHLNSLIQACTSNIGYATQMLTGIGRVDVRPVTVEEVARGIARFEGVGIDRVNEKIKGLPVEKLLGEYLELKYIGGGGFADVYKALTKDNEVVALKVPRDLKPEHEEIFFNEIDNWKGLSHRNIVKLIRPRVKPQPHIVLEYVDGGSLRDRLRKGKLSVIDACKIAYDVASALEYAHSKLIAHTDINPKNVLLTSFGEAKLTDFGLAKVVISSSGIRGLTLPYSSPEQLKGKADERTDVYQLGLLLYEMITGFNPFDAGERSETERRIGELIPEPPSKYVEGVEELDDLIMRCLAKDPRERPSVREFRERIYEFMKKTYGISLHLTKDHQTYARMCVELAFYAAKNEDLGKCLSELNSAKQKILDSNKREEIINLIKEVEYRIRKNIGISDEFLRMFEALLKQL